MKNASQLSTIINKANGAQSITNILEIKGQIPSYILTSKIMVDFRWNLTMVKPAESIVQ